MNLSKILELQALNIQSRKINNQLNKSEAAVKYMTAKNVRTSKKAAVQDAVNELMNYNQQIEKLTSQISTLLSGEIEEIAQFDYDVVDEDELKDEEESIKTSISLVKDMDSRLNQLKNASLEAGRKLDRLYAELMAASVERDKYKPQYEALAGEVQKQLDEINAKINKQKGEMSADDCALYETAKAAVGAANVFVPLRGSNCSGCGMDIGPEAMSKIISDGHAQCPNCHRHVYNEN